MELPRAVTSWLAAAGCVLLPALAQAQNVPAASLACGRIAAPDASLSAAIVEHSYRSGHHVAVLLACSPQNDCGPLLSTPLGSTMEVQWTEREGLVVFAPDAGPAVGLDRLPRALPLPRVRMADERLNARDGAILRYDRSQCRRAPPIAASAPK